MNDTNLVNDILKQKLVELLDKGEAGAVSAVNWLLAQAPDVAKQYLQWEIGKSIFWICFCVIGMLVGYMLYRVMKATQSDGEEFIPLVSSQALGWIGLAINTFSLVKVLVAPKLVLIDFVIGLVHK
jgi:choline-glycine betaine transporter